MAQHVYTYENPPSPKDIQKAVSILKQGGVIAYPTDFNWGIGCDASQSKAIARMRKLKPGKNKPFSLICADISMAAEYSYVENWAYRQMRRALPGPFTLLLKPNRNLEKVTHDKRKTVGIRIPHCPMLLELVKSLGAPLANTSVPEGREVIRMGWQVAEELGHCLDLILDLGEEVSGLQSTIIDFTSGHARLVRQGMGNADLFDLSSSDLV